MSDGKILDAKAHGNLIVNDAVRARGKNAQKDDLELLHRSASQRLTRTRSATAGEGERELEWVGFHNVERSCTAASGWLHRLVRSHLWIPKARIISAAAAKRHMA